MKKTIFMSIIMILTISILFYLKINDGELLLKSLPYAIIFVISICVLMFIIYKIGYDLCDKSDEVKISKFKLFKYIKNLQQNGELENYENFCISLNNNEIIKSIQQCLCLDYHDAYNIVKNKELTKIKHYLKGSGIEKWRDKYKQLKNLVLKYDTPTNMDIFISYYNNTLLQNKNNVFSILLGFVSFIISLVSLLGISAFESISYEFYITYIIPLLHCFFSVVLSYKDTKKNTCKYYDRLLEKFDEQNTLYKNDRTKINQDTKNNKKKN